MTLRFGIVGAGGIAAAYLQIFADLPGATITAVADIDADAARAAADRHGAAAYSEMEEMLAAEQLDAVVVCTPPATHPVLAITAVAAGVAVLCEKPLAVSVGAAQRMVGAANGAGVPITTATKFRFVPGVMRARDLVREGVLGELITIENIFASRVDMRERWNSDPAVSGGGVLIDNGTHSVDIARAFLGPIEEVLATEGPRVQGLVVEDSAQMLLRAESGATGSVELSWSYDNATDTYLQVYGSEGALRLGWQRSELRTNADERWTTIAPGYDKLTCMRAQVENFCAALRGEEPMAITDADAISSVGVIDAAYRSLALGDWAPVENLRDAGRAGEGAA